MPLRAVWRNREVLSVLLSDAEWVALKKADRAPTEIRMACCASPGYPRESVLGTRHFVHSGRQGCTTAPESALHLLAKSLIATTCAAAGAVVVTEAAGPDWRADVLVSRDSRRWAFEVQVSPIAPDVLLERNRRYLRDGIRAIWLMLTPSRSHPRDRDLASFQLLSDPVLAAGPIQGATGGSSFLPLSGFCQRVLAGSVAYSGVVRACPVQEMSLSFVLHRCRACRTTNHVHVLTGAYRSVCGLSMWPASRTDSPVERATALALRPEAGLAVRALRSTTGGRELSIGVISVHPDRRGRTELAVGCRMCGRALDRSDFRAAAATLLDSRRPARPVLEATALLRVHDQLEEPLPHWCVPVEGAPCSAMSLDRPPFIG